MGTISYRGFRFPPSIIQHAIWLYVRFGLSLRNAEDLLAERGIKVSDETVRCWIERFGPAVAKVLRGSRPNAHSTWQAFEETRLCAGYGGHGPLVGLLGCHTRSQALGRSRTRRWKNNRGEKSHQPTAKGMA